MVEYPPLWTQIAARAEMELSEAQLSQLSQYLDLLSAANQRMNLTRITDRAAAEVQHIGDSLTVLPFLPKVPHRLADVGSGGGVPGIPLAIARPDVRVVLIESTKKKPCFYARPPLRLVLRMSKSSAIALKMSATVWTAKNLT